MPHRKQYSTTLKISASLHMGNACIFPSIFHNMAKRSKTHRMEREWEIGAHTFAIVWLLWFSGIQILCYPIHYIGNGWVFPSISHRTGKRQHNSSWERPGSWIPILILRYGYFSFMKLPPSGILSSRQKCMNCV